MNTYARYLVAALLMALAVSASAAPIVIPKDTVIPVTMDEALGSATSRVGSRFYAHHSGVNGAGFPEQTRFTGNVNSVTMASGKTAGQIGVSFVGARLPDGTRVPIVGQLTSLDDRSVQTDPATGRLVGTTQARKADLKFVAYGAGAGLLIGQLAGKKALLGTILGAAAGYLYGQKQAKPAIGKDVLVPAGTPFGILLAEDATIPDTSSADSTASTAAGPVGPGWQVTFKGQQPEMSGNDLMVPFRSVMDSIGIPFSYEKATRTVRMDSGDPPAQFTLGTKLVDSDGKTTQMDAASRIVHGSIYVPASYIELVTHRTAYWNQKSGVLRIE